MPQYTTTVGILRQRSNESDDEFQIRLKAAIDVYPGGDYPPTCSVTCHTYGKMIVLINFPEVVK